MTDTSKIIEKIQKLLALSKSSNEHEAALATERVQALLAKYNITMLEIEEGTGNDKVQQEQVVTKPKAWQRLLRSSVARMYFCEHYFSSSTHLNPSVKRGFVKVETHFYVGAKHNTTVAIMMSEHLIKTIRRLVREKQKDLPKNERQSYGTSFFNSCSRRLCIRIQERIEETKKRTTPTTTGETLPALTSLYNQHQLKNQEFIDKNVGRLKSSKSRLGNPSISGSIDGESAGNSINLDRQVGQGNRKSLR